MAAPKKAPQTTSPKEESDGKKDALSTPMSSQPEPSVEPQQKKLRSVFKVLMAGPTEILNQASRHAVTATQGLTMWEDPDGKGVFVVSTDERVRGIDLIPWANIRKVSYETDGTV